MSDCLYGIALTAFVAIEHQMAAEPMSRNLSKGCAGTGKRGVPILVLMVEVV